MSFSSTIVTNPAPVQQAPINDNTGMASLLSTVVLTMYAAQKSKKQMRQLKRRAFATLLKLKLQSAFAPLTSLFSKKAAASSISNRTLLYILLGLAVLILLFVSWPAAVVLLLLGILLVLLTQ